MDMRITGPDADQFHFFGAMDPFCGNGQDCASNFELAPGASRSFNVVCAPSHPGFFKSTLTVKSNAADDTSGSTIALDCTGDAPAAMSTLVVSPASIDFGVSFAEPAFPTVLDRTLTVTNTAPAPSVPVAFQVLVPGTTGNGFFTLPLGEFGFVGPGESQDFVIAFQWFGAVVSTAPVVLQSFDPNQPSINVPMFAEAAYGHLAFDDPPTFPLLLMPAVAAGETSTLTVRGHNDGDFELNFSDSSAFATFGGTMELQGATGFVSVAPGETIQWTLTCTPDGSEGAEDGASGFVTFNYITAASDFDSFTLFCPILSPALLTEDRAIARAELPDSMSTGEPGGCSASPSTNLAPFGTILLGLLTLRRMTRRHRAAAGSNSEM
jgi:MYXO-CTERM domain-containing protein